MKIKLALFSSLIVSTIAIAPSTSLATVDPPTLANPGDFLVDINPGEIGTNLAPKCTPDEATIGGLLIQGKTAEVTCTVSGSDASSTVTGTASNPTLATAAGDAGFTSGLIDANCSSAQSVSVSLTLSLAGLSPTPTVNQTINTFSGKFSQGCTFAMSFQDAASSKLFGTIEVNARLGNEDGSVVGNVVNVTIAGKVFITSGTGVFSGYAGSGTFSQSQEIDLDISKRASASSVSAQSVRATADSDPSTMSLTLTKSKGQARIVSPAPPAGSPKGTAKVKASTKIKVTAPAGSTCTVKTSSGKVVGTGKVSGKYSSVTIKPRSGAYRNAKKIVATCTTKAKKTLKSNSVKVSL